MSNSYHDHNGKEIVISKGKSVKISTEGWNKIRKYCFDNSLKMGSFIEKSALEKISSKIKSSTTKKK